MKRSDESPLGCVSSLNGTCVQKKPKRGVSSSQPSTQIHTVLSLSLFSLLNQIVQH
jgi:hypothetical protein